jgi:sialate O-acetylesterase
MKPALSFLTALVSLSALHAAELKPAAIFSDHMVLQREQPVPVWGWADPDETVSVTFGSQKKTATAGSNGKWTVGLDPMPASAEGRELIVRSTVGNRTSRITDVVVGDVWLCSGQSNMHFQMKSVNNAPNEIAGMDHSAVRFFTVAQQFAQKPLHDVSGAWKPVTPATAANCSAVACYFGIALHQKLGIPIGLVVSSVGGTRIESWMRSETLASTGESIPLVEKWKNVAPKEFARIGSTYAEFQRQRDQVHPMAVKEAKAQGKAVPPPPVAPKQRCHDAPGSLHNGMIEPLEPFAIRGAIWYQGESNSGQPGPYEKLLPAMIADWRKVWGKELPFLFVQIAPHRSIHPAFREAQLRIWQNTPHTAMVVTTDVGDAQNIHPTRKRPVGERLALAARALSYGEKIEYSGPVFRTMNIEGDSAVISFSHLGSGLMAKGDLLKGFTIAAKDGKFVPADAVIEGSTVVVTSGKIAKPVAVRYGWTQVPDLNLFNREGLPAAPFRTDMPEEMVKAAESN